MNQKQIGILVIIAGLIIGGIVFGIKLKEDFYIDSIIEEIGSCYLADGTCLHDGRDMKIYIIGFSTAAALLILGLYLRFFDKSQEEFAKQQLEVTKALAEAKKSEKDKDEFYAYLQGFSDEEQKILKVVKDQEGIKQSTLRFKTGLSKTSLSLLLKSLESRKVVSRKESGKSKQVFLIKKF